MEGNWRPTQSAAAEASMASYIDASSAGAGGDWRFQLQPEARQWIVNKIMDALKRHLPISVPEGINELREIAIWCEEKIYTAATSQSDYLRKISLKMFSMETKNPPAAPINPGMPNPAAVNQNPTDPGSIVMQSQPNKSGQPLLVPNRQSILRQNLQNNTSAAVQGSSGMSHTLPPILGLGQSNIPGITHASNLQNMSGISQSSVNNSIAQGAQPDIYANSQRQLPGRQQQEQQQQSQNPLLYRQQLLNRKLQHSSLLQHPQQQQQQSLLQPNQMQSTQASLMQMSASLQQNQSNIQQTQPASTQAVPQPGLQPNQLNQIQQSVPSLLQNPSISRQQQVQSLHQQAPSAQQQSTNIPQQSILSHQQQMMGQQGNMSNMQQNQLLGQQNNMADIQQQQQRLPIQQNNLLGMQHQQLMNQQTLNLQQQQLGSQSNMSGLQHQQQLLGLLPSVSNMQPHQLALMKQKNAAQQQQQYQQQQQQLQLQQQQQQSSLLLQSQGPQSQNQSSQQQLMSQYKSQPSQSQQQLLMQQQSNPLQREMQQQSNPLQWEMQQRLQSSGPIVQTQNAMEQKPFIQAPTSSVESTTQTGRAGSIDWQEECYQKVKSMKELYFAELTEFHQMITLKLQQQEALISPGKQSEQHEKLKGFRQMLERMLALLQINKNDIPVGVKEKLPLYEKQILSMVASHRAKKTSPHVQGQQQFQHPNAGNAQTIPQQQQSQSMEVSEPASFQAVQEEPTFSCPICMCALVSPFTTVCGHIFCEGCIKAATKKQKKCPTCRSKLTGRNNIHRVFLPTSD